MATSVRCARHRAPGATRPPMRAVAGRPDRGARLSPKRSDGRHGIRASRSAPRLAGGSPRRSRIDPPLSGSRCPPRVNARLARHSRGNLPHTQNAASRGSGSIRARQTHGRRTTGIRRAVVCAPDTRRNRGVLHRIPKPFPTFLRWHYPDQVRRDQGASALSQPVRAPLVDSILTIREFPATVNQCCKKPIGPAAMR